MYYRQEQDYTCALACIRMITSEICFEPPSEQELIKLCHTAEDSGTHPDQIINFFKLLGCEVEWHKEGCVNDLTQYDQDPDRRVLLLLSTDVPHCVVYRRNNGNHIFFDDPWYGSNQSRQVTKFERGTHYPFHRWDVDIKSLERYYPQADIAQIKTYEGRGQYIVVSKKK